MTSIDNKGSAHTDSIVEALLPNITDVALDDLAATTFIDGGVAVPVTPADQLFMAAARRLGSVGGHGVLLLPRVRNRAALLLAITSHVLRLQPPTPFRGPVVFVGMDLDVSGQLRQLSVQHRRRMGLADGNPLSLHRLTRGRGSGSGGRVRSAARQRLDGLPELARWRPKARGRSTARDHRRDIGRQSGCPDEGADVGR
ncbi:MAG: hypothetical protein V9E94_19435 [Microthrixaceae bacterium]